MYGRVVGSSSQSTSANQVDEPGDSPRFAETLAGMEPGGSSSETRAYYLNSGPPIVEIDQRSFDRGLRRFLGRDIMKSPLIRKSTQTSYQRKLSGQQRLLAAIAPLTMIQPGPCASSAINWVTKQLAC